jgi:hypothetical protein
MSYREHYSNADGELMGYGTVYDDGLDPDDFYDSPVYPEEYGDYYDEPVEPERCELDWEGGVCLFPLDANGDCGRTVDHNH